jgi:pentapeptide MXKDX repeat protein
MLLHVSRAACWFRRGIGALVVLALLFAGLASAQPGKDDVKKDEPKKGDVKKDDVKKDEPKKDDVKKDDVKSDDPKKDDPKKDDPKKDDPKKDDPKKDDPKKDDPKKDDPKKDDPKKDDPKKDDPKKDDEPKKDEPKKEEPKKLTPEEFVKRAEELRKKFAKVEQEALQQIAKAREEMRKEMAELQRQLQTTPPGGFPGGRLPPGRLGVFVDTLSKEDAEKLGLDKGKGLVIVDVAPDTAAAKAGLKASDVLAEFNGKPVPSDIREFVGMVAEPKAGTAVDIVVLRKGKKETIKGVTLPEARAPRPGPFPFPPPGRGFRRAATPPICSCGF